MTLHKMVETPNMQNFEYIRRFTIFPAVTLGMIQYRNPI